MESFNLHKLLRFSVVIVLIIICLFVFKITFIYTYPFLIAMALAYLLHPLVSYIERTMKIGRGSATFITMGTLCVGFFAVFYIFTERLITGFLSIATNLPENIAYIKDMVLEIGQAVYDRLLLFFPFLKDWQLTEALNHFMEKLSDATINLSTTVLFAASDTLSSLSYFIVIFIFIFLAVYMLTKDYYLFKSTLLKMIPKQISEHFHPVITYTKSSFLGLFRAQLLITSLSTIIILICFYFYQLEYFFTLAVIIFFVDFIPYLGIGIIFIPWILFLFITGDYVLTIKLSVLYSAVLIFRQLIEPKIIAKEIGVHPFVALSILFIGYQTMGLLGILLTPLILILVSAIYKAQLFTSLYDFVYRK